MQIHPEAKLCGPDFGMKWNETVNLEGYWKWWPGTELNRRRQPFQGCALPTELPGRSAYPDCTRYTALQARRRLRFGYHMKCHYRDTLHRTLATLAVRRSLRFRRAEN
jgi:hypothetical protein